MGDFDENKAIKKIIEKIDGRYLDEKYKPTHRGYDLLKNILLIGALFSLIYSGYSWVKIQGKNEAQLESLFKKDNPLVKRKELTKEIKLVRHDMNIADTTLFRLSNTKYTSLKEAIKEFGSNQKSFEKKIDRKIEKQTDRIIEVIRNQNK